MKRSKIDRWVYEHTKKPKHYVEVRNPPRTAKEKRSRPQDARQVQYNQWSKHFKVYSGSYLPKDEKKLLRQGWVEENPSKKPIAEVTFFRRKSTNQWIRHDYNKNRNYTHRKKAGKHWHWFAWWGRLFKSEKKIKSSGNQQPYYNRYGELCDNNGKPDSPHHIAEEGKEFVPWQKQH